MEGIVVVESMEQRAVVELFAAAKAEVVAGLPLAPEPGAVAGPLWR